MVALYIGGNKVGTVADLEKLLPEFVARRDEVELRDDAGTTLARLVPGQADDPDWVRAITPEEIERRRAGPFLTLEEYREQADRS
jgi:hypothetical protein